MGEQKIKQNQQQVEQKPSLVRPIGRWPWEVRENRLAGLTQVSQFLAGTLDRDTALEKILEATVALLKARRGFILLMDSKTQKLSIKVAKGMPASVIPQVSLKLGEGISGFVAEKGRPFLVDDLRTYHKFRKTPASRYESEAFFSVPIISAPLITFGKTLGVMNVSDTQDGEAFTTEELALLSVLAVQAGMVLAYWQLVEGKKLAPESVAAAGEGSNLSIRFNELQNPLNAIVGHVEYLLLRLPQECKAAEVLRKIIDQTSQVTSGIKGLQKMIK